MRTIVFTGHRRVPKEHERLIRIAIRKNMENADEMVFGGAIGADTIALSEAAAAQKYAQVLFPESKTAQCQLTVVVAANLVNQPADARMVIEQYRNAIDLIELGLPYIGENLKLRNRVMIDRIKDGNGKVLAYWNGVYISGTYSAMCYGDKLGIEVENILGIQHKRTVK
jgi:hypothetical protein